MLQETVLEDASFASMLQSWRMRIILTVDLPHETALLHP